MSKERYLQILKDVIDEDDYVLIESFRTEATLRYAKEMAELVMNETIIIANEHSDTKIDIEGTRANAKEFIEEHIK